MIRTTISAVGVALMLGSVLSASAQTEPAIPPPFTSPAAVYSGISGPGKPVVGDGAGGWRSNQEVLRYDGPDPKPGWQPLGSFACTGAVVKQGLLPPIKPLWDLHLRDTVICVGPDKQYYMTGSSGDNIWDRNDGIEIWRSQDLRTWDYLGLVWSFEKDGTWQKKWGTLHDHQVRDIWAPELHYLAHAGKWVLMYSLAGGGGCGILVSTSGKPEGPYANPLKNDTRLLGGIDPTIFEDEDGKIYVTAGRGGSIGQLNADMSDWAIPMKPVQVDKSDARAADGSTKVPADLLAKPEAAMEGASLFKRDGKYYLGGAVFWNGTGAGRYDSVVAISDNIWGPYRHWHEAVPCGGGTNYFQANDGQWFCCFFGNDQQAPFREKPAIVAIDFDADGRIKIADDQPAFILQPGAATHWRTAPKTPATISAAARAGKSMMDYFLPTPIVGKLDPAAWGAPNVLPRDRSNGLEDPTMMKNYCYWDGNIIKAKDGKYHMFASRWDQSKGHNGWGGSVAIHAVSDNLFGPYVDKGMLWPDDQGGKGHNVTALTLPNDEGYAVVISETRPGTVYTSKSLDGPWVQKGLLSVPDQPRQRASNVALIVRPDGDFEMIQRSGQLMISKAADGILGPYKAVGPSVYPKGIPNLEDPCLFYAGGMYHITVNSWSTRTAYHLVSADGLTGWTNVGVAYQPDVPFVRYTDGTINKWKMMERPAVYIENNEVKAFTFAVIDVTKQEEKPNDLHGSKVIVVPFDGAAFNADMKAAAATRPAAK